MSLKEQEISKILDLSKKWLEYDPNETTRNEIQSLIQSKRYEELDRKLSKRIAFGTAGLRSNMSSGFAHMNDVTVTEASQGLIEFLIQDNKGIGDLSIVVGYDHRHNSQRFAELTASAALSKGVKVYYLGDIDNLSKESVGKQLRKVSCSRQYAHTPLVPFAVDYYSASAGVMITASHNPAADNGYKVYYSNGCQIIPPIDQQIATCISQNLKPWFEANIFDIEKKFLEHKGKLIFDVYEDISSAYIGSLKSNLLHIPSISSKFVYTPMHGVGLDIFEKLLKNFEYDEGIVSIVEEQAEPDPDFSTVKFPNPEEKGALALAIQLAEKRSCKFVIANDPDADRFSVAVRSAADSQWIQLSGNEIGFLFAMYIIEGLSDTKNKNEIYLLNSTVSSQILALMSKEEGFNYIDTLTGFKWIGNKAIDLKKQGFKVPFAYEEAIGYMFGEINDKDGVAAACVWLQLYEKWFTKDPKYGPIEKLADGYAKYGWLKQRNGYYIVPDTLDISKIFDENIRHSTVFRGYSYPKVLGTSFRITYWRDLTVGYESTTEGNIPVLPVDKNSQMITVTLEPNEATRSESVRCTFRGSGTEPKLKVYIEAMSKEGSVRADYLAQLCWDTMKEEWFKPDLYKLIEVL